MLYHGVGLIVPLEVIGGTSKKFQLFLNIPTDHFIFCLDMNIPIPYGTLNKTLNGWMKAGLIERTKMRVLRGSGRKRVAYGYMRLYCNPVFTMDGRVHLDSV